MAQNYISRGEVISLTSEQNYVSGNPYRLNGFNGVALLNTEIGNLLSFQLEGVFELELARIEIGDLIYIYGDGRLSNADLGKEQGLTCNVYGRAVTASKDGKFYCRLLQS